MQTKRDPFKQAISARFGLVPNRMFVRSETSQHSRQQNPIVFAGVAAGFEIPGETTGHCPFTCYGCTPHAKRQHPFAALIVKFRNPLPPPLAKNSGGGRKFISISFFFD